MSRYQSSKILGSARGRLPGIGNSRIRKHHEGIATSTRKWISIRWIKFNYSIDMAISYEYFIGSFVIYIYIYWYGHGYILLIYTRHPIKNPLTYHMWVSLVQSLLIFLALSLIAFYSIRPVCECTCDVKKHTGWFKVCLEAFRF
jgi:hypothetical protein